MPDLVMASQQPCETIMIILILKPRTQRDRQDLPTDTWVHGRSRTCSETSDSISRLISRHSSWGMMEDSPVISLQHIGVHFGDPRILEMSFKSEMRKKEPKMEKANA